MTGSLERLCLACGLCCDGTLFASAPLEISQHREASLLRLRVILAADGSNRLRQPCGALEGTACRIYDDRPRACRDYECDLFVALRGDELDEADALRIVQTTLDLRDRLARSLPPGHDDVPLRQRVRDAHRPEEGRPLTEESEKLFLALEEALDQSFRGRRGR